MRVTPAEVAKLCNQWNSEFARTNRKIYSAGLQEGKAKIFDIAFVEHGLPTSTDLNSMQNML